MLVEVGHDGVGNGPAVTYANVPDYAYPLTDTLPSVEQVALHLQRSPDGVTHLPGMEPVLALIHADGALDAHKIKQPRWIRSSDGNRLGKFLAEFHDVPSLAPADLQDTHWTMQGGVSYAPGAIPDPANTITALVTTVGHDLAAQVMYSPGAAATIVGDVGTATATTATSLTGGGGATHASNDAKGMMLVSLAAGGAYGYVTGNTSGATPVFTVDRWYNPTTPGGTAAATPGSTTLYALFPGGMPFIFMGLTATSAAPVIGDTVLAGEYTVGTGDTGLIRKVGVSTHTAGTNTSALTAVFTASGVGGGLPTAVAKLGISQSIVQTVNNLVQTLITTATLNLAGDQLTATDTFTGP